ncbi:hypothetical protein [Psychromicrobium lacuslunae]|uniref:Uncharacterized protein n=1 Tax=Psychromicrobium lacuslunae TaxID=1618207 RepID=A0A0D4C0N1_9MICC|nr:hypothetical protein [Psychromicrobium lacuslunae]AJT41975.1 hypothetical protein UM93_11480 [Psychromicrobium lacuslunae]
MADHRESVAEAASGELRSSPRRMTSFIGMHPVWSGLIGLALWLGFFAGGAALLQLFNAPSLVLNIWVGLTHLAAFAVPFLILMPAYNANKKHLAQVMKTLAEEREQQAADPERQGQAVLKSDEPDATAAR